MEANPFWIVNFASTGQSSQMPVAQQTPRLPVATLALDVATLNQPSGKCRFNKTSGSEKRCGGNGNGRDLGIGLSAGPDTSMTCSHMQEWGSRYCVAKR